MVEFQTSLLREKFVIRDVMPAKSGADDATITALSNRLVLPLTFADGSEKETFVVRAQNMHSTVRFGALIVKEFMENGKILGRATPLDWDALYQITIKGYEEKWNPDLWLAVYHNGRVIYEQGAERRHTFLDIIEQCDMRNSGDYSKSMEIATDAFRQAGKLVDIKHDSNVALVMSVKPEEGKCGIIVRGPYKTTTFNLTARAKAGRKVKVSECLTVVAAFLEGIQLAFLVGLTRQKLRYELIEPKAKGALQAEDAAQKIARLNSAISQFENMQTVFYRPERPNLSAMIPDAEEFARKILAKEIETRIASGELDQSDWVQ